jgi:hypothetical protein
VLRENRPSHRLRIRTTLDIRSGLFQGIITCQIDGPDWPIIFPFQINFRIQLVNFIYLLVQGIWITLALLLSLPGPRLLKLLGLRKLEGGLVFSMLIEFWCGISKSELVEQFRVAHIPQRRHTPIADRLIVGVVI